MQRSSAPWVADEVFGIVQGLPPHSDKLQLTPRIEPGWEEPEGNDEAGGPVNPQDPQAE